MVGIILDTLRHDRPAQIGLGFALLSLVIFNMFGGPTAQAPLPFFGKASAQLSLPATPGARPTAPGAPTAAAPAIVAPRNTLAPSGGLDGILKIQPRPQTPVEPKEAKP